MQLFPEPSWGAEHVQIIETKCTNSLYTVQNPYVLTGFFVQWVRALFKNEDNITNNKLKGYLWDEDPTISKITIAPSFKDNSSTERRHPAIYVKRGSITHQTPGMQGGLYTLHTGEGGFSRGKELSSIMSGSHNFTCSGDTEAEAENIGIEIFESLSKFSAAIKTSANLGVFWVSSLSETQKAPGGKDYWVCSVKTTWHYSFDWTLDRDAPILKEIGYSPVL